jgi:hypothetical protein
MDFNEPKFAKIQTNFKALSSVAGSLNTASDELTKAVSVLDEALKKLNIGLTVWVDSIGVDLVPPEYDMQQIGYSKVNNKWGIALRRIWGDESTDQFHEEGPWLFSDAPREMRLYGVDKISALIEALSKEASTTTKKIQEKTQEVRELASAIEYLGKPPAPPAPVVTPQKPPPPPAPVVPPNATVQKPPVPPAPPNASNALSANSALSANTTSLKALLKNNTGGK